MTSEVYCSAFSIFVFFFWVEVRVIFQNQSCWKRLRSPNYLKNLTCLRSLRTSHYHLNLYNIQIWHLWRQVSSLKNIKFILNIYICNYLLFEALIFSASFLFSAFSSKLDEFVLLAFPWIVSLILRFKVVVLESLCTYFLSPLHSYVQWPISKHFWHLCVLVSSTELKEKSRIGKCIKCL